MSELATACATRILDRIAKLKDARRSITVLVYPACLAGAPHLDPSTH